MARSRTSAGLLMFRRRGDQLEVLLAHPGGPFFEIRMTASGRYRKAKLILEKICCVAPKSSSKRRWEFRRRAAIGLISAGSSRRVAKRFTAGHLREICRIASNVVRTCSKWNGRHGPERCKTFRRSIRSVSFRWKVRVVN